MLVNPFRITDAPGHMTRERMLRHRHIAHTLILATAAGAIAFYAAPLIVYFYIAKIDAGPKSMAAILHYWQVLLGPDPWAPHRTMLHDPNFVPFRFAIVPGKDDPQLRAILAYICIVGTAVVAIGLRQLTNPYRRMVMKQDASWCDAATLRRMEERGQVGIRNGYLMELGKWRTGLRAGQPVRMIETLSTLCLAPPGTGKTAGLVIPSLIGCDTVSFIVNDPKPELYQNTGFHRASIGHVFMIDWSKVDEHRQAVDAETGTPILDASGQPQTIHNVYAKFNPLSPKMVPPEGADRDTYVATVAQVLIPSSDTKGEGEYFVDKGRDALTGMIHMLLARVNDRLSDDPRRYEGMPEQWVGKEASLPMLVDWWAHALYDVGNEPEPPGGFDNERAPATKDTLGAWIRTLCDEINPETRNPDSDGLKRGTTARGFGSLSQLVNMADRERSGVIGTMDKSLLPFKNAAVKERTESSDFTPDDLRGIQDENGEWKPVTLYICVNQAEAAAFATLTALLYELLSRSLLSYGPNSFNPRTRRQLGPFAVGFMMDEFAKLPRIPAVLEGPDIGRSMGVFYALISQDYGQIEKKYSAADVRVINTVTSVKHILPQNEPTTIKAIIEMVGKTTIRRGAHSFSEGMGKNIETFKWNRSDTMEETDFLRQEEVAAMKTGTHIVLVQGFMNRPMHLNTPLFFEDPAIAKKVWSRGKGPVATETLPRHIGAAKIAAWNKANDDRGRKAKKNYEAVSEMSLATGESVAELS